MDCKRIGEMAELKFIIKCLENDLVACRPYGDNSAYDFIVDSGNGKRYKVQVKSTSTKVRYHGNKDWLAYRIVAGRGKGKVRYADKEVDFFACYIGPEDTWYIVPSSMTSRRGSMSFKRNDHKANWYRWAPYCERWGLLKGQTIYTPTEVTCSLESTSI